MFTDAARAVSAQVRSAGAAGPNVAAQGAAAQRAMVGASRPVFGSGGGGKQNRGGAGGGSAAQGSRGQAAPAAAAPAHGAGVAAVARNMSGAQPPNETRPDRTAIDRAATAGARANTDRDSNAIDGIASRTAPGELAGDHTTPPQLQKYLD